MATPCSYSVGCVAMPTLPKEIHSAMLEEVVGTTRLSVDEVRTLYARFRRLAPSGNLTPSEFKQSMGLVGSAEDAFLPNRLFSVFDVNGDGHLDFVEFATSLAVMLRGSEDEKLTLSFHMVAGSRGAHGITLDNFQQLVKGCSGMMASFIAPSSTLPSDDEVKHLFYKLADHGVTGSECVTSDASVLITLPAYKKAVHNSTEFLALLGLVPYQPKPGVVTLDDDCQTRTPLTSSLQMSEPGRQIVVPDKVIGDLRGRIAALSQIASDGSKRACSKGVGISMDRDVIDEGVQPQGLINDTRSTGVESKPVFPYSFLPTSWWCTSVASATDHGEELVEDQHIRPQDELIQSEAFRQGPDSEARTVSSVCEELRDQLQELLAFMDEECNIAAANDKSATFSELDQSMNQKLLKFTGSPRTPSFEYELGNEKLPRLFGCDRPFAKKNSRKHEHLPLLGPKKGMAVHFGHEKWNMVVSMMIGIRMAVGRSKHEVQRELVPVDYFMKEKFSIIPVLTNFLDHQASKRVTLTRFIDYAPMVFQRIRLSFGITSDEYLRSVGPEALFGNMVLGNLSSLSELTSEGKSGAFFYYTADGKYMMKTVTKKEYYLFRNILERYHRHIMDNPNTLIVRFLGLHCLSIQKQQRGIPSKEKLYFVVMANMFNTPFQIHHKYDLKGSWIGRVTASESSGQCMKDVDFMNSHMKIKVGTAEAEELNSQIEKDSNFLKGCNIIDYSLLVGIHNVKATDDCAMRESSPYCGVVSPNLDSAAPLHQRDRGGLLSVAGDSLYLLGIIDILTEYDSKKQVEHHFKALWSERDGISCCPPALYASRFNSAMREAFV